MFSDNLIILRISIKHFQKTIFKVSLLNFRMACFGGEGMIDWLLGSRKVKRMSFDKNIDDFI